jgi:adenylate kinase
MVRVLLTDQSGYLNEELASVLAEKEHTVVLPNPEDDEAAFIENVKENVDIIVLDLVRDAANANRVLSLLTNAGLEEPKVLIGVSSVMTWNETKTKKNKPLTEADYKNRKCTPKFKELKLLETLVLSANSPSLNTFVVAPGVLYGGAEASFADLFRDAWMSEKDSLAVIGEGNNSLPLIHVKDCANFLEKFIVTPPEGRYLVLIDQSDMTQRQIIETISQGLGTGKVSQMAIDDEKLLLDDSDSVAVLASSLQFNKETLFMTSLGEPEWHSDNFKANFEKIRLEFTSKRGLAPLRVAVLGAPGSGKTFFGSKLAAEYNLPLVDVNETIKEALAAGDDLATRAQASLDEQAAQNPKKGKAKKAAPKKGKAKGKPEEGPVLPPAILAEIVRRKLLSPLCRNKGFVLDGFPRTAEEASALFELKKEGEEEPAAEEDAEKPLVVDTSIMVQFVVSLDVTRDEAQARLMDIPQDQVIENYNDEDGFQRRWAMHEYVMEEKPEGPTAPVLFFKNTETLELPAEVCAQTDVASNMITRYVEGAGRPFNFHPTPEEVAAQQARESAAKKDAEARAQAIAEQQQEEERQKAQALEDSTAARKSAVLSEDAELVEEASLPLRRYLMKNVIPSLVDGLLDACKTQPDDPVDYLAEYLFRATMTPQTKQS